MKILQFLCLYEIVMSGEESFRDLKEYAIGFSVKRKAWFRKLTFFAILNVFK